MSFGSDMYSYRSTASSTLLASKGARYRQKVLWYKSPVLRSVLLSLRYFPNPMSSANTVKNKNSKSTAANNLNWNSMDGFTTNIKTPKFNKKETRSQSPNASNDLKNNALKNNDHFKISRSLNNSTLDNINGLTSMNANSRTTTRPFRLIQIMLWPITTVDTLTSI